MSEYTPNYMEPYYKSRIAELERELRQAKEALAKIALRETNDTTEDTVI